MNPSLATLCVIVAAYLVGSVSFAVVVSKLFGLPDPHSYGSGNPGATNVLRTGNKPAAALTLLGDGLKGFVAVLAATIAAQKPGTILSMVSWAFSIAGSAFFPALVLGIFWERATRAGALAGMLVGILLSIYYILRVEFDSIPLLGISGFNMDPWFHIQSTSSGLFGVLAGFLTIVVVSLLTRPDPRAASFLKTIRFRNGTEQ